MYIRKISRKNKDGSSVTYVQLAHNERDSQKGFAVAKVVYSFGRLDDLDIEQLRRLAKSISRFLSPEQGLEIQTALDLARRNLKFVSCRSFGGIYLLATLWHNACVLGRYLKKPSVRANIKLPSARPFLPW